MVSCELLLSREVVVVVVVLVELIVVVIGGVIVFAEVKAEVAVNLAVSSLMVLLTKLELMGAAKLHI